MSSENSTGNPLPDFEPKKHFNLSKWALDH